MKRSLALLLLAAAPPTVVWNPSPNYTSSSRTLIDTIVIHTTEGADPNGDGVYTECYTNTIAWFKTTSSKVSAHYVVSPNGEITQMVAEKDIAWHATYYNKRSIGIECAGHGLDPGTWTPALIESLANLVAYLAGKYGVPVVHPDDDANGWGGWYKNTGLIGHSQVQTAGSAAAKAYAVRYDPGPYFPWASFVETVKKKLAPTAPADLAVQSNKTSADLSWSPSSDAEGYRVDLADSAEDLESMSGSFRSVDAKEDTSTTVTGLSAATPVYWRVLAYNSYGSTPAYPDGPFTPGQAHSGGGGRCGMVGLEAIAAIGLLALRRRRPSSPE